MKIPRLKSVWLLISGCWFLGCLAILYSSLTHESFKPGLGLEFYCLGVVLFSVVAFFAYAIDKWKAQREKRRIPEKMLHFLAVVGGWPGAVIGQQLFRHKTLNRVFHAVLVLSAILHLLIGLPVIWNAVF